MHWLDQCAEALDDPGRSLRPGARRGVHDLQHRGQVTSGDLVVERDARAAERAGGEPAADVSQRRRAAQGTGSVAQSTMSAMTLLETPNCTVPPPDILLLSSSTMAAWPMLVAMVNVMPRELPASPRGSPRTSP